MVVPRSISQWLGKLVLTTVWVLPATAQPQLGVPANPSADPAILRIRIVEGDEFVYAVGSRATRGVVVLISDETGRPVEGATVSFRLPDSGPTGEFAGGGRTEIAMTASDGRAEAWGMQWNSNPGPLDMRITASKGQARAGTLVQLYLMEAAEGESGTISRAPGKSGTLSSKKLWISVAVIGGALGAVAGLAGGSSTPGAASPPVINAPQIGSPEINISLPTQ